MPACGGGVDTEGRGSDLTQRRRGAEFLGVLLLALQAEPPFGWPNRPVRILAGHEFIDFKSGRVGRHLLRGGMPFEIVDPLPREGRFQGFSSEDVIYLIMPDRFARGAGGISDALVDRSKARYYHGGNLQGIIDHLGYLQDLGVTAIWITPVYDNVNHLNEREKYDGEAITDYHGYGAVDFYRVEEHLGDLAKLRELVDAAHQRGLKVILDMVANHTGPYHRWVSDPPTPTWFNGTLRNHLDNNWQIWTLADPHATPAVRKPTLDGWFLNILPDLNQNDPEVARYLIQNTLWWIGATGIDGIREDTWPYVPRRFWRQWLAAIRSEYPKMRVAGEVFDPDPALVSSFQERQSLFDFPLYFEIRRAFIEGGPLREVAIMLARDRLYPDPNALVTFLGLHDVTRFMNEPGADAAGMKLAWTFLMTARGIPMIYYGDEIGMRGGKDPDNRRDFPGGWARDPRNAFKASGRTPDEQSVFERVRRLTHLRRELEPLRRGAMVTLDVQPQTWVYARGDSVIVALNNGRSEAEIECDARGLRAGVWKDVLGGAEASADRGRIHFRLAARSAAIYR